jgi:7-carboxy-7-deazaguanine synthase
MKISEIFSSIQGEGKFAGYPMLFIRTSGCTRSCSYCDTKYHSKGKEIPLDKLAKTIRKSKLDIICFTGGEPLLQREEIYWLIKNVGKKKWHIETNGDLLQLSDKDKFDYIACSPKEKDVAKKVKRFFSQTEVKKYDIKVVTDMKKEGIDMIKYATMLMPQTYTKQDQQIQEAVWKYCVKNNIKFTGRLQYYVFRKKRGI